jgi:F420-0:gamma-glutamyl ligase-like protein
MTLNPSLRVTIEFDDPELEPEERDKQAQRLIAELRDLNDVETVERVADSNLSEGTKSIGGFLVGLLTAEVKVDNSKKLFGFLKDRLGGKLIEFTVEANGKKLTAKASSREELDYAIAKANDFIEKWQ